MVFEAERQRLDREADSAVTKVGGGEMEEDELLTLLTDPSEARQRSGLLAMDAGALEGDGLMAAVASTLQTTSLQPVALTLLSGAALRGEDIGPAVPRLEALSCQPFTPPPGVANPMLSAAARATSVLACFHLFQGHSDTLASEMARPGWRGLVALHALRSASKRVQLHPFLPWLEARLGEPPEVAAPGFPEWATRRGFAASAVTHERWLAGDGPGLARLLALDPQVVRAALSVLDDHAERDPGSIAALLPSVVRIFQRDEPNHASVRRAAAQLLLWGAGGRGPGAWIVDGLDIRSLPEVKEERAARHAFARRVRGTK